jgi:hypothetical protein
MKHSTFEDLKPIASVTRAPASKSDIRRDRLLRFATLLEAHPAPLRLFRQVEYMPNGDRAALRCDCSPVTVAYADPVLRAQGLNSDEYGAAVEFFGLSEDDAHHLLCDCHYGLRQPSAQLIAYRVRAIANRKTFWERCLALKQSVTAWLR